MKQPPKPDDLPIMPPDGPDGPTEFGEPTQVVHARAFPREWEVVDPRRNENILVQIGQGGWEFFFKLEAIGDDGCFVRVVLPEDLKPFPLDNDCRLVMNLGEDGTPLNIQGKVQSAGINSLGEATVKILFKDVTVDDAIALSTYRERLKEIPDEPEPEAAAEPEPGMPPDDALAETLEALPQEEPRTNTRKRILRALGGAAAAVFLFTAGGAIYLARSPEGSDIPAAESSGLPPLVPIVRKPTLENASCSVLFDELGYRAKCPGTTKPRLIWKPDQQKGAPVLRAGISYRRGSKHCETAPDAVAVIRGQSMSAVGQTFTCGAPQR